MHLQLDFLKTRAHKLSLKKRVRSLVGVSRISHYSRNRRENGVFAAANIAANTCDIREYRRE